MSTRNNQPDDPAVQKGQAFKAEGTIRGGCIAIGNFDGVHLGHQSMLHRLRSLAAAQRAHTVIITFHPHPVAILRPEQAPPLLTTIEDRLALLRKSGADHVEVLPVTQQLLNMSATEFFDEYIRSRFDAKGIVEGANFRFGQDRRGDVELLRGLCDEYSIALDVVDLLDSAIGGQAVVEISSSRIRTLIADGRVAQAVHMLGHPYRIRGVVSSGAGRGRTLGFPTANLIGIGVLLPGHGVYAGVTTVNSTRQVVAVHIGPNPTFSEVDSKVECHILDFHGDLYGAPLYVDLIAEIRPLNRFSDRTELMDQIRRDLLACRELTARY